MTDQELSDLASFGTVVPIDATGYAPTEAVAVAAQNFQFVRQCLADFREAASHVRISNRLTPEGKAADLGALGSNYLPKLDAYGPFLTSSQELLQKLRDSMTITSTADDAAAQATLHREIRDKLPTDDQLEVRLIYFQAIADGDQDVFDAIRLAPKFLKLLSPAIIAEGEQRWAKKRNPAQAKKTADLANAITVLTKVIDDARTAIRAEAKMPQPDSLAAIAGGVG